MFENKRAFATSASSIQQLAFVVSIPDDSSPRCPVFDLTATAPEFDGPSRAETINDHTARICVSTSDPKPALNRFVARFSTQSGGDNDLSFVDIEALDGKLRPIVPPPVLSGG